MNYLSLPTRVGHRGLGKTLKENLVAVKRARCQKTGLDMQQDYDFELNALDQTTTMVRIGLSLDTMQPW